MLYVIRKVPERDTTYLEKLLPNCMIYNDVKHIGAINSFLSVLSDVDEDAVYVQDDMLLCKDFMAKAEEYIKKYPYAVIVFSNFTHDKECRNVTKEGWYKAEKAGWLLCTYIPKGIKNAFLRWWNKGEWKKYGGAWRQVWIARQYDDVFFQCFLQKHNLDVFVTVPNLAGHPKNQSVIDDRPPKITPNFDYENAEKKEE